MKYNLNLETGENLDITHIEFDLSKDQIKRIKAAQKLISENSINYIDIDASTGLDFKDDFKVMDGGKESDYRTVFHSFKVWNDAIYPSVDGKYCGETYEFAAFYLPADA
jgi:hypothetical protein